MCTALQQIYISSYLPPNSSLDRNHFVTAQSGDREMRENDVDDNCISGHSTTQQTFPNSNTTTTTSAVADHCCDTINLPHESITVTPERAVATTPEPALGPMLLTAQSQSPHHHFYTRP